MENYGEDEVVSEGEDEDDEEERREIDGDENDDDEEVIKSTSGSLGDDRPFILPKELTVNDFLPMMSDKVFKTLHDHFQIPDNIPIRLLGKFEKCYTGKTANIGMYDAMFKVRLRLPITALHRQLANFRDEILWGCLSGRNRQLTLDEFFWCYRLRHIVSS